MTQYLTKLTCKILTIDATTTVKHASHHPNLNPNFCAFNLRVNACLGTAMV